MEVNEIFVRSAFFELNEMRIQHPTPHLTPIKPRKIANINLHIQTNPLYLFRKKY